MSAIRSFRVADHTQVVVAGKLYPGGEKFSAADPALDDVLANYLRAGYIVETTGEAPGKRKIRIQES